jgi:hypothetical protein
MIRSRVLVAVAAAGVLVSNIALAFNWTTSWRNISEIRQAGGTDGYQIVFATALTSDNDNPLDCTNNTVAEPDPGLTAAQKDLLSRTVLSALLAGKMIKLHIKETGACINNSPVYQGVRIQRVEP